MILDFTKELEELKGKEGIDAAFVLAAIYSRGYAAGTNRAIEIVQKMAVNPMPIAAAIRKPIR